VRELEQLQACAGAVRRGEPWTVAVVGEPGIGKTALVRRAADTLTDFELLWAPCSPEEQDCAFGVVDQLSRRLDLRSSASAPHLARGAVLDATDATPVEIGVELFEAVTAAQAVRPVAVVVEDVQWADDASMSSLGVLARRMWHERILLLVTARPETDNRPAPPYGGKAWWQRLIETAGHGLRISLNGMAEAEARELIRAAGAGSFGPAAVRRLLAHTDGNPLYLNSLVIGAQGRDLADPRLPLPIPESLTAAVRRNLDRLAPDGRRLVEALAILGATVPLGVAARIGGVSDPVAELEQVLDSGLVKWWPGEPSTPVCIQHALQQQAVIEAISPSQRRVLHAAAAPLVGAASAWAHRVAAADRFDAALAAELEAEADKLSRDGQPARAATLDLWAAGLTESRQGHDRRLLTGAVHLLFARDYARCLTLQESIEACSPSGARACALGGMAYARNDLHEAQALLSGAIEAADAEGAAAVAELACVLLGAVYSRQHRADRALPVLLRAVGLDLPAPRAVNYARHLITLASENFTGPSTEPLPADLDRTPSAGGPQIRLAANLLLNPCGILSAMAGELHAATPDLATAARRQRIGEPAGVGVREYFMLAAFQYLAGAWDDASLTAHKSLTVATATGQLFDFAAGHAIASMMAATQGRWDVAEEQLKSSERGAERSALPLDSLYPVMAQTILAQARGDTTAMDQALRRFLAQGISRHGWWLPLLIEARTGSGQLEEAAEALAHLEALAEDVPGLQVTASWLEGALAQARGDAGGALRTYRTALELPRDPEEVPLHRIRLEHALGRMLLTLDQTAALHHLHQARSGYTAVGALAFAARAAEESGEPPQGTETTVRAAAPAGPLAVLTEREQAVARLAVDGKTNKEVAESLYISTKTVEYHLGHVFAKLGLTSRRQLRSVFGTSQGAA
jgi:DNA-binding CsgD family transcriptional regulator